ncbi:ferric iron uptake transcriptional regulator [Candidatus Venteria ishoeyi]|uniref:Ferric uptake regulation protein n=1 Tax=Candidatus Venteria ishoeyi TaxID=1899563 RepID=A0A1H6F509_9GAMM|nr:ferric iron uptake transcriptional regulator [Candidatus Venteria ishoeyi]MDM8545429.1 ferric iron uptake transcriptional regulator [Candidatus Venteria ishoeyi]SEH04643.1 Ferric uptake regulation protein [Candidatus Venteria ishoeyi]
MESNDLKRAGLKTTLPRMRILQLLEHNEQRHMSAEDVYKALLDSGDDIGLATVYRVLTQFETAGLVHRHHFESGLSVFELNQGTHHDHLVCMKCGKIFEFSDEVIEQKQQEIASKLGFDISDHCLYLYGMCNRKNCEHNPDKTRG